MGRSEAVAERVVFIANTFPIPFTEEEIEEVLVDFDPVMNLNEENPATVFVGTDLRLRVVLTLEAHEEFKRKLTTRENPFLRALHS